MESEWSRRGRLLFLLVALAATVPAWPFVQPGSPVADELIRPGEVAMLVPIVMIFPVAWALLARTRTAAVRVGLLLILQVAAWSLGTIRLSGYGTPPTVDDFLRWFLVCAGVTVAVAALVTRTSVRRIGSLIWILGVIVAIAVPVVGKPPTPPGVALPPGIVAAENRLECYTNGCTRVITIASTGTDQSRALTRQIADHLARTEGWRMRWYPEFAEPDVECKVSARLTDPYRQCLIFRSFGDPDPSVEVRVYYSNPHDPVYRTASQDSHIY